MMCRLAVALISSVVLAALVQPALGQDRPPKGDEGKAARPDVDRAQAAARDREQKERQIQELRQQVKRLTEALAKAQAPKEGQPKATGGPQREGAKVAKAQRDRQIARRSAARPGLQQLARCSCQVCRQLKARLSQHPGMAMGGRGWGMADGMAAGRFGPRMGMGQQMQKGRFGPMAPGRLQQGQRPMPGPGAMAPKGTARPADRGAAEAQIRQLRQQAKKLMERAEQLQKQLTAAPQK